MKTLVLSLLITLPCFASAGSFEELQSAQSGKAAMTNAVIPVPVLGLYGAEKAGSDKLYYDGNQYTYAPAAEFTQRDYTYDGCIADESKARAELAKIAAALKEAKLPVLQSRVNLSADCIDYTIRYISNLDPVRFTYSGWLPDRASAQAALRTAVANLEKAGIRLILQASVNEKAEGVDYTVSFLAYAELRSDEYVGYLPTPAEAGKAMEEAVSSLNTAEMPVLQATVRTSEKGSDYLIKYVVPKQLIPDPVAPYQPAPAPAPVTGCKVKDQSWTTDSWACRDSKGKFRCYADAEINGGPIRIYGGCYESTTDCWSNGVGAVNPCN